MELLKALQKRRSVRRFTEEAVSKKDIDILMHAAMSGPSACNARPWDFYVVESKTVLQNLHKATKYSDISAPLAIVVCRNLSHALPAPLTDFWVQDCSAATENILLAATGIGLGAVWCGIYPNRDAMENVKKTLGLPEENIPLNIIHVGHPDQFPEPRDQYDEKHVHLI